MPCHGPTGGGTGTQAAAAMQQPRVLNLSSLFSLEPFGLRLAPSQTPSPVQSFTRRRPELSSAPSSPASEMGVKGSPRKSVAAAVSWVRRQPPKTKVFLGVVAAIFALLFIRAVVHDHSNLFVAAEAVHAAGIAVLIYKFTKDRSCAGLSLKTQELTALFLAVRLYCSLFMEGNIHTLLDTATLAATGYVIYMMRFDLKSTYMHDKDNFKSFLVVIPCVMLTTLAHPTIPLGANILNRMAWAFCVYLEAVSVLPQLRLMQNIKIIEPFTAHYVFALGIARFLNCAHWILQMYDTGGLVLTTMGFGFWPIFTILAEIVQTFILADFCYYYVKSVLDGQLVVRLPSGVV